MNGTIRVLVADNHAIVRKGIRALLATEPDMEVVGEAADGQEAIVETQKLHPDVVVMDLSMPAMNGVEAIRRITDRQPDVRVLVLTSFTENGRLAGISSDFC
jgi:DNA-binding NarL/FixJ family response regulator